MHTYKSCLAIALLAGALTNCPANPIINDGQKLAFLGDSITQNGADHPGGYTKLVVSGLEANGINVTPVFAGVSGHTSKDMLARLNRDVLSKKPDFMTLNCGVNDVWHGPRGVPLDQYKTNITAIVDQATSNNIKVVILTATMIYEDPTNAMNQKLAGYNEFLKQLAAERHLPLADLNSLMQDTLKKAQADHDPTPFGANYLTVDGVHMNPLGDVMMAEGILRAFGLDDAQISKAQAAWLDLPASERIKGQTMISLKDFNKLVELADKEKVTLGQYIDKLLQQALEKPLSQ